MTDFYNKVSQKMTTKTFKNLPISSNSNSVLPTKCKILAKGVVLSGVGWVGWVGCGVVWIKFTEKEG